MVYTEDRETDPFSELRNRGFVVKMNRLFHDAVIDELRLAAYLPSKRAA